MRVRIVSLTTNARPVTPIGSYKSRERALAACVDLAVGGRRWAPVKSGQHPNGSPRYAIVRVR